MRFSSKFILGFIAVIAVLLVPIAWMAKHRATWGPAEQTESVLRSLANEIIENNLAESEIIERLKSPQFEHDGIHEFHVDIEKRPGELIWFAPNKKYTVGLSEQGSTIWMLNGKRTGD